MSITNHCSEENSTPYCSFLDIESSFSPSFFSNMKGARDAHNPDTENTDLVLPDVKVQNFDLVDFTMFSEYFSHETYMFL